MDPHKDFTLRKWASSGAITEKPRYPSQSSLEVPILVQSALPKSPNSRRNTGILCTREEALKTSLSAKGNRPLTAPCFGQDVRKKGSCTRVAVLDRPGSQIPGLLGRIETYLDVELRDLDAHANFIGNPARVAIYRKAFQEFASSFQTYEKFLCRFMREQDAVSANLEAVSAELDRTRSSLALAEYRHATSIDQIRTGFEKRAEALETELAASSEKVTRLKKERRDDLEKYIKLEKELQLFRENQASNQSVEAQCTELRGELSLLKSQHQLQIAECESLIAELRRAKLKDNRLIESLQGGLEEKFAVEQNFAACQQRLEDTLHQSNALSAEVCDLKAVQGCQTEKILRLEMVCQSLEVERTLIKERLAKIYNAHASRITNGLPVANVIPTGAHETLINLDAIEDVLLAWPKVTTDKEKRSRPSSALKKPVTK